MGAATAGTRLSRFVRQTMFSRRPREFSTEAAVISLLVMLFVSLLCWKAGPGLSDQLSAIPTKVLLEREYWRLWTSIAVHADISHFAFNAVFLGFFSYLLYGYFGFWVYPVGSLVFGGVTTFLSLLSYPAGTRLIGSSGLVYLMAGFWLMMYVLVERRFTMKRRLLRAIGFSLVVFFPTSLQEGVSYRTHAIGFSLGAIVAVTYFQFRKDEIRSAEVFEAETQDESGPTSWE